VELVVPESAWQWDGATVVARQLAIVGERGRNKECFFSLRLVFE